MLYSNNGAPPAALPPVLYGDDGLPRTGEALVELALERGWVAVSPPPEHDPATQHPPVWNRAALAWVVAKRTPDELGAEAVAQAAAREAELIADATVWVQEHLDEASQARGYESIHTLVTYADEPAVPRFQAEGQAGRRARSLVWARCYELLDEVRDKKRPIPTKAELIALLPAIEWPAG